MTINIEKITLQNFMSYGKKPTEFEFKSGLDLVSAKNGSGKSSLWLDGLTFALYGKPFRKIKIGSLVNKVNKNNLLVTLEFSVNDSSYKIERGLAPSVFNLFKNGELVDPSAANRDYQKMLEDIIIKTPETIFRQIIVLGANISSSKNFMDLSPKEKEEVFQKITDTKIFNLMSTVIDQKIKKLKTFIQELSYKKSVLESNIGSLESSLFHIEKQNEFYINKKEETKISIQETLKSLEEDNSKVTEALMKLKEAKEKLVSREEEFNITKVSLTNLSSLVFDLESKIKRLENSLLHTLTCKKCGEVNYIEPPSDIDMLETYKTQHLSFSIEKSLLETTKIDLESKVLKLKEILLQAKPLKQRLTDNELKIKQLSSDLVQLETYIPEEMNNSSLETMKLEFLEVSGDLSKIQKEKDDLDFINSSISSENIKGLIIAQELPFLNKFINEYLEKFSLIGYNLIIDKNFKDKIISRSEENEYNQMSNGQKARINFSIMFALLKMLEQRNGVSFNLLVLDEVLDSSLDSLGREELLGILFEDFRDHKDVVVISHNSEVKEKVEFFSRIIEIDYKNFSDLKISEL
jgi:DNA repair exonuclease SbcCD ATPase subunit